MKHSLIIVLLSIGMNAGLAVAQSLDAWEAWPLAKTFRSVLAERFPRPSSLPYPDGPPQIEVPNHSGVDPGVSNPRRLLLDYHTPHPLSQGEIVSIEAVLFEYSTPADAIDGFWRDQGSSSVGGAAPQFIEKRGWTILGSDDYAIEGVYGRFMIRALFAGDTLNKRCLAGDPKRYGWNAGFADVMLHILKQSLGEATGPFPGLRWVEPGPLGLQSFRELEMVPYAPPDADEETKAKVKAAKAAMKVSTNGTKNTTATAAVLATTKSNHTPSKTPLAVELPPTNSLFTVILSIICILGAILILHFLSQPTIGS